MKYILKIVLLCVASIPFFIWEGLKTIWTFRTDDLIKLWKDVSETIDSNYRRIAPRRARRNRPSTFVVIGVVVLLASCKNTEYKEYICTKHIDVGQYQIYLNPDNIYIFDGGRFVDSLTYSQIGALDSVIIKDNE